MLPSWYLSWFGSTTQNGFEKPVLKRSKLSDLDSSTCTICEILRRIRISRSQVLILPVYQYPKWCGNTRIRSDDHLWFGWFKLHIDWFFKEILNLKREIYSINNLYAIWTSQIRDGHLTLSWYPHTIWGIAGYTGRIRTWDVDILILLKISHMVQVKPSKSDNFDFFTAAFSKPFWVVLPN